MVTIIAYNQRQNSLGDPFISLQLQGDVVMVQSQESGHWYATAKQCSITSTFTEDQAKALIGRELPGRIEKVPCEAYEYVVPETAESIMLSYRWEYLPEGEPTPLRVVSYNPAA